MKGPGKAVPYDAVGGDVKDLIIVVLSEDHLFLVDHHRLGARIIASELRLKRRHEGAVDGLIISLSVPRLQRYAHEL